MNVRSSQSGSDRPPATLARNTGLNVLGELVPLLVSVFAIPAVIQGLGIERFGILSLAWVTLGYFSLFDLGLGRATIRYAAEQLRTGADGQQGLRTLVWTSFVLQGVLGLLGTISLALLTPVLATRVFAISPAFLEETKGSFYWLSSAIPFLTCATVYRGLLEAEQRFDLVNAVKGPTNCLVALCPLVGLWLHLDLAGIVSLQVLVTMTSTLIYQWLVYQSSPWLKGGFSFNQRALWTLSAYAWWAALIMLAASCVTYLDRFLTGLLLSAKAVGYYTPPYTLASKLWLIPQSLFLAVFPVFSALATTEVEELERVFTDAHRLLVLAVGPITVILVLFAHDILRFWLGAEFVLHGSFVLQMLAVGFLLNAQAWVPSTLLQGVGRPDVVAKIFLFELPLYTGLAWWCIGRFGIQGAAVAWAVRGGVEALLFLAAMRNVVSFRRTVLWQSGIPLAFTMAAAILGVMFVTSTFSLGLAWRAVLAVGFLAVFTVVARQWLTIPPGSKASSPVVADVGPKTVVVS